MEVYRIVAYHYMITNFFPNQFLLKQHSSIMNEPFHGDYLILVNVSSDFNHYLLGICKLIVQI